jgi:predicted Zn-dependent protease
VAAVAVCVAIRVAVMGNFAETSPLRGFNSRVAWAALGLLGQHAKLFFWGAYLTEFRAFDLGASLRMPWPWLALLVLVAVCWGRHREPRLSFLVLWWYVTLLPCLNYRQLSTPLVADRFSYLPSVGLCLGLGYLAFGWAPQHISTRHAGWVSIAAVTALSALWTAETMRKIPHWRDDQALTAYALLLSPNAAELHGAHAVGLQFQERDYEGATREFQTALRLNAQSLRPIPMVTYDSYIGLGQVALEQGHKPEAIAYFERAASLVSNANAAYDLLGSIYFPQGDYTRAAEYFQQAVRANPLDMAGRFFLGSCWMKLGKPAQAAEQFHAAREVDPTYSQAYTAEAMALEAAGDHADAARVRSEMPAK